MALKLYERYPQLWESPSNDYPQGAFKNLSAQGETDGSYLEKDWLNDYSGFFGALLRNAEITPDGTIDTAQKSQFYDALVKVAKSAVGEEGYRKLDDNIFNGYLQVRSEQGTGVSLQDTGGTVRGQVVATDQGLQLTQYPKDGTSQTFTFPIEGGEVATTSYVDDKIVDIDTSNLVTKDDITNELGDSTELVASQKLVNDVNNKIDYALIDFGIMGTNERIVKSNPFDSDNIITLVEVLYEGTWGSAGFIYSSTTGKGFGTDGGVYGRELVVVTGGSALIQGSKKCGGVHPNTSEVAQSLPVRMHVWRINK